MNNSYIPQNQRKKILLISDDIRTTSGVASQVREFVIGCAHRYNFCCIGGSINHPDKGKQLDLSQDTNNFAKISDSYVKIYPTDGYGNSDLVRQLIKLEKPDAIFIITDPRYFTWLFAIENEIRTKIPIIYLNIWDDLPYPFYNKSYYESCDALFGISKQTVNINKVVLGDKAKDKIIKYTPHGINEEFFFPIHKSHPKYQEFINFKNQLLKEKQYDFTLLYNARNIRRKCVPDLLAAYKLFCDKIGKEKAKKCSLVLHTSPIDEFGTDLIAVREMIFNLNKDENYNVIFSDQLLGAEQMNYLYNLCDANILVSSNEGFGLSLAEARICGKMIIANVQGGMIDQMRFEDEEGNWIDYNEDFATNEFGRYKKCGEWAIPVFPNNMSIVGSIPTPYIYDSRCDFRDVAKAIEQCYNLSPEERQRRGGEGRNWTLSDEAKMTAKKMSNNIIEGIDELFATWKPRKRFELIKIEETKESVHYNEHLIYE